MTAPAFSRRIFDWRRLRAKAERFQAEMKSGGLFTQETGTTGSARTSSPRVVLQRTPPRQKFQLPKMRVYTHSSYTMPLPANHRFPMHRYKAVHAHLAEILSTKGAAWTVPQELLENGTGGHAAAFSGREVVEDEEEDRNAATLRRALMSPLTSSVVEGRDLKNAGTTTLSPVEETCPLDVVQGRERDPAAQLREALPSPDALLRIDTDARLATREEAELIHEKSYIDAFEAGEIPTRALGFPWSPALVERTYRILGGTLDAVEDVLLQTGLKRFSLLGDPVDTTGTTSLHETRRDEQASSSFFFAGGNLAGGTHHAFPGSAEGFCVYNDLAVAARYAQELLLAVQHWDEGEGRGGGNETRSGDDEDEAQAFCRRVLLGGKGGRPRAAAAPTEGAQSERKSMKMLTKRNKKPQKLQVVIIDVDVHQGNGTAACVAEDPSILTFSLHAERNYPFGDRRRTSDVERNVDNTVREREYLLALQDGLREVDDKLAAVGKAGGTLLADDGKSATPGAGDQVQQEQPQLLVLFQAGVDPLAEDRLGKLKLSRGTLWKRNQLVLDWVRRKNAPVVITMGGGYSRPIDFSVKAHCDVYLQAAAAAWGSSFSL
ncbi:unnamed protein product [Amoebophrya sp. A120]|nr:unnamed protein product [Amoebophrya sp. A120]|eukprot:GSA120T00019961001.1